jgi:hypothetical protein
MSNKTEQRPKTAAVLPNNNLTGVPNVFRRMSQLQTILEVEMYPRQVPKRAIWDQ